MLERIQNALENLSGGNLTENALDFFSTLGYESTRQIPLDEKTFEGFDGEYGANESGFNQKNALVSDWNYIDLLFQLTGDELIEQDLIFSDNSLDQRITSYLFFVIELKKSNYNRTQLSQITREINKVFLIPVMILFKYSDCVTLSVIDRRPHKRDEEKDVLRKVTQIKDINIFEANRAHLDILEELSLFELQDRFEIANFLDLHNAWQNTLNISNLNKKFYKKIIDWFDWAITEIKLPDLKPKSEIHKDFTIRLIARLIFVWFLKELKVVDGKLLIPNGNNLIKPNKNESAYYKFVLQNLFFNALNKEHTDRNECKSDFDVFASFFDDSETIQNLIGNCPFLNGGLFDEEKNDYVVRTTVNNAFVVPDVLFLGNNGLNTILSNYKFTVTENTPFEEEVAVEPDMLGRIFENLLAEQTDDTKEAARKNAGAFYTPRPIVSYMCKNVLLRHLDTDITPENGKEIVHKLLETTVIDPACGSGAFPMGMLEEMMNVLNVADPDGIIWSSEMMKSNDDDFRNYIAEFVADRQVRYVQKLGLLRNCLYGIDILPYAVEITKLRCWLSLIVEQKVDFSKPNFNLKPLPNLEFKFYEKNSLLRTFKGADIEPLLRHFDKENLFEELIDLENNFFITKSDKHGTKEEIKAKITDLLERLVESQIEPLEITEKEDLKHLNKLLAVGASQTEINRAKKRHEKTTKALAELYKFKKDIKGYFIEPIVFPTIFSPGIKDKGFDIVIGNPPYVNTKLISQMNLTNTLKDEYGYCDDLYNHFTIRGMELLKQGGYLTYITSDTFLTIQTKENMRQLFLSVNSSTKTDKKNKKQSVVRVPPQQIDIFGNTQAVQTGFNFSADQHTDYENEFNFDEDANCRLLEIINTPKAFAAMVDTAIFTVQKQLPTIESKVSYIDIRFPNAETFGLTEEEWLKIKEGSDNYASWEKILEKVMSEIQLPISSNDSNQPHWDISHDCDKFEVFRDFSTNIEKYQLPLVVYHQSLNFALFAPNKWNSNVYDKVIKPAFPTFEKWWSKIETSKRIDDNRAEIQSYIKSLKAGDITLLGLITDGGQGLATGDNGKFVGVIEGTRIAERIIETRPQKLMSAVEEYPSIRDEFEDVSDCVDLSDYQRLLNLLSEKEIRNLFDSIKDIYGRRVFSKGYLFRIVSEDEVYDVNELTDEEKQNGIDSEEEIYVPYDKGDKDGNRWYLETPYRINWSVNSVSELQDSDDARWQGFQFFFQNGFCWSDILNPMASYIKTRLKNVTVNDVKSMSLFDQSGLGDKYLVSMLNSFTAFKIIRECFNSSVSLQMNDLRKLPIKIPTNSQLETFNEKFDQCFEIKKRQFSEELSESEAMALLKPIEKEIDELVEKLYGIKE